MATTATLIQPKATSKQQVGDKVAHLITLIFAATVLLIAVILVFELWWQSAATRQKLGWGFLFSSNWNPVTGEFGALTFLVELLAAVPSVIYGLLAIFTLVPLMRSYGEPFLKATLGFLPFFQG